MQTVILPPPSRASTTGRVLCFRYSLLANDIAQELRLAGLEVHWLDPRNVTPPLFAAACSQLQPDFIFTVNFSPEVAWLASRARVMYLSWTIDPLPGKRLDLLAPTDPARCVAFAHRHALVASLARAGIPDVGFLPLAAARHRFEPTEASNANPCDVSFVGSSLADDGQAFTTALREMGADGAGLVAWNEWLEAMLRAREGDAHFVGIDPDRVRAKRVLAAGPMSALDASRVDASRLADAANGRLSQRWRARVVQTCAAACTNAEPPLRFAVWGDAGWMGVTREHYRGVADHGDALRTIYATSRVNVDAPRLYQRDIVTLRVFDVIAQGGLVLTEMNDDVRSLFAPEEHLVTYKGLRDLASKVVSLAADPGRCAEIGQRGRIHALAHHRLELRVETMLDAVRARARAFSQ